MMAIKLSQDELLCDAFREHVGKRYDSDDVRKLINSPILDWANQWPVIDVNGNLTGEVADSDECYREDYVNVRDLAAIQFDDLPDREQTRILAARTAGIDDGYASV